MIVKQALVDILERLQDMNASPRVRELRNQARSYERAVNAWEINPPSDEQRAAMVRCVIDLNVEVIHVGRERPTP